MLKQGKWIEKFRIYVVSDEIELTGDPAMTP
jgi:hypothetical protein